MKYPVKVAETSEFAGMADTSGNGMVGWVIANSTPLAFEPRLALINAAIDAANAAIAWAHQSPLSF